MLVYLSYTSIVVLLFFSDVKMGSCDLILIWCKDKVSDIFNGITSPERIWIRVHCQGVGGFLYRGFGDKVTILYVLIQGGR